MKQNKILKEEVVEKMRPNRLQYSLGEAAYQLSCSPNTAKKLCVGYLYKMDGVGVNFIRHDDLVSVIDERRVLNGLIGGFKNGRC